MNQEVINKHAQSILDMMSDEYSTVACVVCLTVIDHITNNKKANATFKKQTADLLEEQALNIRSSLKLISVPKKPE